MARWEPSSNSRGPKSQKIYFLRFFLYRMNYKPVIGLEIHVELKTKSKMFCQCSGNYFGKKPNTNVCPVCLGMPGALPVPNKKAIEWTILIGLALGCKINLDSKFDRKHYFYPDLPKGYQISQYDEPIAINGHVEIRNPQSLIKKFRIRRVHLEEDTAKLVHAAGETLIDFNRSGVPLVEIVTEPDFDNSDDVKRFLEELQVIIRYLEVSDADMEKGTMRLEPNISVKIRNPNDKDSNKLPNYKVEVKNINSFSFVKKSIDYEVKRQVELLEKGETPKQETRGFNEAKGKTFSQRMKEEAQDYRYFPEPDIPPLRFTDEQIENIKKDLPELPEQRVDRFVSSLKVKYQDAFIITRDKRLADYFEDINKEFKSEKQAIANLIVNRRIPTDRPVDEFVRKAKEMLKPKQTDRGKLKEAIEQVIAKNRNVVADYKGGKTNAIMFLVGQVMKEMKGQADAQLVKNELIKKI